VTVQGVATDNEIVAQYMRDLQKEKTFGSVDLDYTKAKTVKKDAGSFQEFAVNLRVVQKQPTPSPQESKSTGPAPAPAKKTTPAPPAKTGK
jgi:Tfp pilus assembly protein PilN